METHPVPQNVTTFQFRLIGDMTIKQFGYLAGGAILAYISYKLPLPFFFTWPLTISFAVLGFGLAFVPIEERPMDVWILSFFKSVYSPTQFVWSRHERPAQQTIPPTVPQAQPPQHPLPMSGTKSAAPLYSPAIPAQNTRPAPSARSRSVADVLHGVFGASHTHVASPPVSQMPFPPPTRTMSPKPAILSVGKPTNPFAALLDLFSPQPAMHPPSPTPPSVFPTKPSPSITGKHIEEAPKPQHQGPTPDAVQALAQAQQKEAHLEEKLAGLQKELQTKTMTESRILELQKQLTELLSERNRMEKELVFFKQKMAAAPPSGPAPPPRQAAVATPTTTQQPTVRVMAPDAAVKAGLPRLTTYPNVVTGIIKDTDNNLLPGVLVTVRDGEGTPLRALKTNRLGQFAASTPLPNGTYMVEVEDPRSRFVFDRVQITLNGTIAPIIEVLAKSHKELTREKLAKELFGKQI